MSELGPYEAIGLGGVHMDGTRDGYAVVDANGKRAHHLYLTRAEAHLFAAAPDLLKACEAALAALMHPDIQSYSEDGGRLIESAERKLNAAISRARGEQG